MKVWVQKRVDRLQTALSPNSTRLCCVLGVKEDAGVDCACRDAFHDSFIDVFDRFATVDLDSLTARLDKSLEEEIPRILGYLSAMQEFIIKRKS